MSSILTIGAIYTSSSIGRASDSKSEGCRFKSYGVCQYYCGVSQWSDYQPHKLEDVGSNPTSRNQNVRYLRIENKDEYSVKEAGGTVNPLSKYSLGALPRSSTRIPLPGTVMKSVLKFAKASRRHNNCNLLAVKILGTA